MYKSSSNSISTSISTSIKNGVWPTMITPYTPENKVDYYGLEKLIEWYKSKDVDGLFAVCQSSEMFYLSLEERIQIAKFVKQKAGKEFPVIASGHISDSIEDQIYEIKKIWDTGIDAFVIVSNRFAQKDEKDEIWIKNADKVLKAVPEAVFGIYECPHPYKRLLSPELLKWCSETGRFSFLKDTCCNLEQLKVKSEIVKGSNLKIFNANSATLLESLKFGISGFSGVMANFHPELYVWLTRNWQTQRQKAEKLQNFIGFSSAMESQYYPINAKYYLKLDGVDIGINSRTRDASGFTRDKSILVEQFYNFYQDYFASGIF